jgi:threonine dehydrogenase-like Zn-dependent dehydrogenase
MSQHHGIAPRSKIAGFAVRGKRLVPTSIPLPAIGRNWALVRVRLAGICNTDVEILRGYHDFHGIPGHEFVGEVVAVNGASDRDQTGWLGKRVAGEINISCSAHGYKPVCDFCRRGLKTHCARRSVLGIIGQNGAFAEYLTLPLENLHLIPDSISDQKAVFVEPLAAACQILDQIHLRSFPSAAVLGDGKLAQLIAMVLHAAGSDVTLYGKHDAKLRLAKQAGVKTRKVRGDKGDLQTIKENHRLVVEATGSPTGLGLAQQMTEPCGVIVLKSTFHGAERVETWPFVVKEITVLGSRCGPFGKAIQLLRSGKVDPTPLISRTFPLEKAPEAIAHAQKSGVMKVLLRPKAGGL